jgi:hypothetical protein
MKKRSHKRGKSSAGIAEKQMVQARKLDPASGDKLKEECKMHRSLVVIQKANSNCSAYSLDLLPFEQENFLGER